MAERFRSGPRPPAPSEVEASLPLAVQAEQMANDLRRHALREEASNHLSPTDKALLLRVEAFLRQMAPKLPPR